MKSVTNEKNIETYYNDKIELKKQAKWINLNGSGLKTFLKSLMNLVLNLFLKYINYN